MVTGADPLLTGYETWMRAWGASSYTIEARVRVVTAALAVWGDPLVVATPTLLTWLGAPHLSPWSRVTYYNHARSFFYYLLEAELRADDPMARIRRPARPANAPHPLSPDDVEQILATASSRVLPWFVLGRRLGLRSYEIAKIRGEHVTDRTTYVLGKGGKEAFLPTHPEVWALAQTFPRKGYWFPSLRAVDAHVRAGTVGTVTGKHFRSLGIEGSIHRARHTYATELLRNGENIRVVQRLMRHSSLATTEAYLEATDDELFAAVTRLAA